MGVSVPLRFVPSHVHHQLPEFTQTHVHRVGDAIQPSHRLSSPSPPAPNPSQHQQSPGLGWVGHLASGSPAINDPAVYSGSNEATLKKVLWFSQKEPKGTRHPIQLVRYSFFPGVLQVTMENPMDGGAWWAAVYGVAQSQTRLKRLSSSSYVVLVSSIQLCSLVHISFMYVKAMEFWPHTGLC